MPTVSSYVGYTIEEPWGQPRVVFGLAAQDAEQLASLLERHDDPAIVYAAAGAVSATRDLSNGDGARLATLSVPPQASPTPAELRGGGLSAGYGEPLYHQAAAAMKGPATGRVNADADNQQDDQADAERTVEPVGALARAASAARAAAEARIKASFAEPAEAPAADTPRSTTSAKGPAAVPKIHATDVLEPLPGPRAAPDEKSGPNANSGPEVVAGNDSKVDADSRPDAEEAEPKKDEEPGTQSDDQPKEASQGAVRRGRMPKAPIPRMSKTKRPGAVSGAQGQPARSERSEPSERSEQPERAERTQRSAP